MELADFSPGTPLCAVDNVMMERSTFDLLP
jgi:hypothetical protein